MAETDLKEMPKASKVADGRRKRSARSREKIIEALFNLVRSGDVDVSAQRVADEAGISLRTVFRHFEEVDAIYREMTDLIADEVAPIVYAPFKAFDWRGRLSEVLARRAQVYEHIMLLKLAGWIRRFGSETLMEIHNEFVASEREMLSSVVPAAVRQDAPLFNALDTGLSFEAWRRYRQDNDLSVAEASAAMTAGANALLKGF